MKLKKLLKLNQIKAQPFRVELHYPEPDETETVFELTKYEDYIMFRNDKIVDFDVITLSDDNYRSILRVWLELKE